MISSFNMIRRIKKFLYFLFKYLKSFELKDAFIHPSFINFDAFSTSPFKKYDSPSFIFPKPLKGGSED